jgi:uncharacterized protein (DUF433 family)
MLDPILDRIVINEAVLAGKPIVKGTRLSVEQVLGHLAAGWSTSEVLANYPTLKSEDVAACLAYARDVIAGETVFPSAA